jgi:hypothetical protein
MQRQRLADAIAPEHCDEFATRGLEFEAADERPAGDGDIHRAAAKPRPSFRAQGCSRS